MGSGPFKFVEYLRGPHWIGKKNPDYWDKGKPYLDGYRAIFIQDAGAQVAAIRWERAMIQFRGFTPAQRDTLVATLGSKLTVQESPWNCSIQVAINQQKKLFDNKRVRRALTLALDRWEGSKALSRIAVVKEVAGIQVPAHAAKQVAPSYPTTSFSRLAVAGMPRRTSLRLSSRISAIASARLFRAAAFVRPWSFAPGISGQ
jgi:peptide/nickel transport system substrate-binding protein